MFGRRRRVALTSRERPSVAIALFALTTIVANEARATPRDPAAAEALYQDGRDLIAKDDWANGCPKFEASMELDPAASTLLNIARCHEHAGKIAIAWADYKRALVLNQDTPGVERQKTLGDLAEKAIAALEPRLPKLKLTMTAPPQGLAITHGGLDYPVAALGQELPADPGVQEIIVTAPGYATSKQTVTLEEGKLTTIDLALTPDAVIAPPRAPPPPTAQPSSSAAPIAPVITPDRANGAPMWTFVVGGLGLAFVGVGVAMRFDGAGAERSLDDHCGTVRICDPNGGYDPSADNARKNRDFDMFVAFTIAGGIGIGAAIVGAATASSKAPRALPTAWAMPSAGGLAWRGSFQ